MGQYPLVVVVGVDGAGKSTLAKRIADECGYQYLYTPQPPVSDIRKAMEALRDLPTRFCYYLLANVAVQPQLRWMLERGPVVVDRYIYCTIAVHTALGVDTGWVNLDRFPVIMPDVGILLTACIDVRMKRITIRPDSHGTDENIEQQQPMLDRAQDAYRALSGLVEIDTSDMTSDEVFRQAVKLLPGSEGHRVS